MNFMIHACPQRMWYVEDFLIPSMIAQGIDKSSIEVFNDVEKLGNLKACMKSLSTLPKDAYGTWHLQDDVVISKYFKKRAEQYDDGLVCGYCSSYSTGKPPGIVGPENLWYSFPCIRIPNIVARNFVSWFYQKAIHEPKYQSWIEQNKFDDEFFKIFIREQYSNLRLRNISPNLVDHVDYMLGGSTINSRKDKRTSLYWTEEDTLKSLERKLRERV